MRDSTQMLLYNSQANLKCGNRLVARSSPGRILGKPPFQMQPMLPLSEGWYQWVLLSAGRAQPMTHPPSKGQSLTAETLFLLSIPGRQEALISS